MPAPVSIRTAAPGDLPAIEHLARRIWPEAYGSILSGVQIAYMLDRMYAQPALKAAQDAGQEFLLAEADGLAVGFAAWGTEGHKTAKLHKLYVLADVRRVGAGRAVLKEVTVRAQAAGAELLVLNVNRNNAARDFYERQGFKVRTEVDIDIGAGYWMNDYVMEKALT